MLRGSLDALDAFRPDGRRVARPGRDVEAVARTKLEIAIVGVEDDPAGQAVEDLVVIVLVPLVTVTRAVAPPAGIETRIA